MPAHLDVTSSFELTVNPPESIVLVVPMLKGIVRFKFVRYDGVVLNFEAFDEGGCGIWIFPKINICNVRSI